MQIGSKVTIISVTCLCPDGCVAVSETEYLTSILSGQLYLLGLLLLVCRRLCTPDYLSCVSVYVCLSSIVIKLT